MATPRLLKILALPIIAALTLGACVDDTDVTLDTNTPAQQTTTVTATAEANASAETNSSSPANDSTISPDESSVDTPPAQCTDNPMASDFAPFLEQARIPGGELDATAGSVTPVDDIFYYFQIGENGYDSCAELSYLVLNGSNANAQGIGGTGGSIADAVILFHKGSMITNPAPFQMKTVEDVTRTGADELEVRYGHAGGATAEGVTEYYTFSFIHGDDGLTGAGSLPEDIDQHLRLYLL